MIQYDMNKVGKNTCTFVAICTNLSNLTGRTLSIEELKAGAKACDYNGNGSLVTTAVKKVLARWNKNYTPCEVEIMTVGNGLREAKKGRMVYTGFRWTADMIYDMTIDGVLDKMPKDQQLGGHSLNLIYEDGYKFIDNYYGSRPHNIFKVSDAFMQQLIDKRFIHGNSYCFIVKKKRRILNIPK